MRKVEERGEAIPFRKGQCVCVCQHSVTGGNRWVAADALQCSNSVVHTLPTPTLFLPTLSVCFQSIHSLTKWCDYPI